MISIAENSAFEGRSSLILGKFFFTGYASRSLWDAIFGVRFWKSRQPWPIPDSSIMHAQKFCQMRGVKRSKFWNVIKGLGTSELSCYANC